MFTPLSLIFHLTRLIFLFLPKKLVGTSILKIWIEIMFGEKRAPKHPNQLFKEKEKRGEGRPKTWWPIECSKTRWPMECSKTWRPMEGSKAWWPIGMFQDLVANGRQGKKTFSFLPIFPLTILLKPSIFPFDLWSFTSPWFYAAIHAFPSFSLVYKLWPYL